MKEQNRNLAARVASAVLLFPTLVYVSWRGGLPFAVLCGAASAIAAAELIGMFAPLGKAEAFAIAIAALLPFAPWWVHERGGGTYPEWMPLLVGVAGMALLAATLFRPGGLEHAPARAGASALAWIYCGFLVASVVALRERFGFGWVVMAFVVTWMNDTFAYFAGRFLGKHPMFPRVSPKKTWEGFAGGFVGAIVGALVLRAIFPAGWLPGLGGAGCFVLGGVASIVGPIGDLTESMLKRAGGVKDSGRLIPGHGGLLDRIDALLFVAPWIYLFAGVAGR